ncbi:MAG: serine hydrolase domain-containing protein, partial [Bacteroidota bacterium]
MMKKPILIFWIPIWVLLALTSCDKDDDNQATPPAATISTPAELTAALTEVYDASNAPGFAVSIVTNGSISYQQAFGKANLENNKPYTNQTIQPIGSISKTFVAAAVVKAIDQGHFTLETDINDILPVAISNPKQANAVIRVKHLVTHTSGLIDHPAAYFLAYHILPGENLSTAGSQLLQDIFGMQQREGLPLDDFLAAYYLEDGELFGLENFASITPGAAWNYSNIATALTAFVVESATDIPFKEYVRMHILEPLGMDHTAYDLASLNSNDVARLYWDEDTPLPSYANDFYPDGSIHTNSEDLTKFLLDMMKGAKGQSNTLFSKEGYDLLFDALLPNGVTPATVGDNQGIFWVLKDGKIMHNGSDPGTTCDLQFQKTGDSGYILLTNMDATIGEHLSNWTNLSTKVDAAVSEFIQA